MGHDQKIEVRHNLRVQHDHLVPQAGKAASSVRSVLARAWLVAGAAWTLLMAGGAALVLYRLSDDYSTSALAMLVPFVGWLSGACVYVIARWIFTGSATGGPIALNALWRPFVGALIVCQIAAFAVHESVQPPPPPKEDVSHLWELQRKLSSSDSVVMWYGNELWSIPSENSAKAEADGYERATVTEVAYYKYLQDHGYNSVEAANIAYREYRD